jgi:hypothetical protein
MFLAHKRSIRLYGIPAFHTKYMASLLPKFKILEILKYEKNAQKTFENDSG